MTIVVEVSGKEPSPGPRAWREIPRVEAGFGDQQGWDWEAEGCLGGLTRHLLQQCNHFHALSLSGWVFNPFLSSTHSYHPPPQSSKPSEVKLHEASGLFTGVGLSELGEKWLRAWSAESGTGIQDRVSRHQPRLQGPSPWPAPAACRLHPAFPGCQPFLRGEARLVMSQGQVREWEG